MEGIELGCDGGAIEREEENTVVQDEYEDTKDLECPSLVELFLTCHLMMGIDFYSFMAETDMRDPQLHVGQLFSSVQEFRKVIRTCGAINRYNVKCKVNDKNKVKTFVNRIANGEYGLLR